MQLVLNTSFLSEVEKRQQRALYGAGQFYLARMADSLANTPARHGQEYWKFDGRIVKKAGRYKSHPPRKWLGKGMGFRKRSAKVHIASRAGEPPALLFGDLRKRIATQLGRAAKGDFVMYFGSNVPYAAHHEEGGRKAWGVTMTEHFPTIMSIYARGLGLGNRPGEVAR